MFLKLTPRSKHIMQIFVLRVFGYSCGPWHSIGYPAGWIRDQHIYHSITVQPVGRLFIMTWVMAYSLPSSPRDACWNGRFYIEMSCYPSACGKRATMPPLSDGKCVIDACTYGGVFWLDGWIDGLMAWCMEGLRCKIIAINLHIIDRNIIRKALKICLWASGGPGVGLGPSGVQG